MPAMLCVGAGYAGDGAAATPLRWLFAAEAAPTPLFRR
jgi:hypothetical protein